jgi:deazaflavin-dependent oxidoreductase (nitroreductase family)
MVTTANESLRDVVKAFNKHALNPVMLGVAGRKYWYAAVIQHVGRLSGRSYQTPVVAVRVDNNLLVPLPYGTNVDWLQNVMAAGNATVTLHGRPVKVAGPAIIGAAAAATRLPKLRSAIYRLFRIREFVMFQIEE